MTDAFTFSAWHKGDDYPVEFVAVWNAEQTSMQWQSGGQFGTCTWKKPLTADEMFNAVEWVKEHKDGGTDVGPSLKWREKQ